MNIRLFYCCKTVKVEQFHVRLESILLMSNQTFIKSKPLRLSGLNTKQYTLCKLEKYYNNILFKTMKKCIKIDLFTDTAAILNLLDLRSIMGCPGGTRSVFTRAFRAKRELHCIILEKKAIIIKSKHGTTIFFSHYNLFLGKLKEKLARKARVNTDASISDRAYEPWASHNTP